MKILNLFAGAGANRVNWHGVITAVELDNNIANLYSKLFPEDKVIINDAVEYLIKNHGFYDFIWASPPCTKNSKLYCSTKSYKNELPDLLLYQIILFLQLHVKCAWVVENVIPYFKPLINPQARIGRHFIWSNFNVTSKKIVELKGFSDLSSAKDSSILKDYHQLKYEGNVYTSDGKSPCKVLRNGCNYQIGDHVMDCYIHSKGFFPGI